MGAHRQGPIRRQGRFQTGAIDREPSRDAGQGELLLLNRRTFCPSCLVKGRQRDVSVLASLGRTPPFARGPQGLALWIRSCPLLALGPMLASPPVLAQSPVTLQDLDGVTITARVVRAQVIRRGGRNVPTRYQGDIKLVMGPGNRLHDHTEAIVHTPQGPRKAETISRAHSIEQPSAVRSRGGGQGVYVFEPGALTMLRTFKSGALIRKIAFTRADAGLACAVIRFAGTRGRHRPDHDESGRRRWRDHDRKLEARVIDVHDLEGVATGPECAWCSWRSCQGTVLVENWRHIPRLRQRSRRWHPPPARISRQSPIPATRTELFQRLAALGIATSHGRSSGGVHGCESARSRAIPGGHTKNLLLKDAKDRLFLVVADGHTSRSEGLAPSLGSARLSFARPELLVEVLGVTPGSVTALPSSMIGPARIGW